jgi:hypothetical protein
MKRLTKRQVEELRNVLRANGLGPCTHPDCDPRQPSCASNAIHLRALEAMKMAYRLGQGNSVMENE